MDLRWIRSSGVGVYIRGLMPGLVQQLADVRITGLGHPEILSELSWTQAANFSVVNAQSGRYSVAEQLELPRRIARDADLFFSPYYTVPLLYDGPLAVTVHDMSHRVVDEIVSNPKKRWYARLMFAALARRARQIFTVSEFSKRELLRLEPTIAPERVLVTPLGVGPEWRSARTLPAVRSGPYFVAVGNVKPYKNVARLVDAFQSVMHLLPHTLVIVGQYEGLITGESPRFFESVRAMGERVVLPGAVPEAELLSLVAHADALVMPSLYEGFGLTVLEAMAAGTPVVCSRAASLPEVAGDAALYFDPLHTEQMAAGMLAMARDPGLRAEYQARGEAQSRRFAWQSCSDATAGALRRAMGLVSNQ
jgi:glycosyltransferase involved in cell wall biosynthesis